MAHHGQRPPDDPFTDGREVLGPTKQFPRGKLDGSDEGELRFAVVVKDGTVIVDFNSPVAWFGMSADQARELGQMLFRSAAQIDGKPLAITIG